MGTLEDELVATLRAVEDRTVLHEDLTCPVLAGVRRRRQRATTLMCATLVVVLGGGATTYQTLSGSDEAPATMGTRAATDCSHIEGIASGVSSYTVGSGERELSLVFSGNQGTDPYTCPIDETVRFTLRTRQGQVTSDTSSGAAGAVTRGATTLVDLRWSNWCLAGPVTATATFATGHVVEFGLGKGSATPTCSQPERPARLELIRVQDGTIANPD